jgi:tRNA threonylcarbamoyladenosine biosynthesis protein TsaB
VLILALDTSSAAGSAAIARDGVVLAEHAGDGTRTHGERLPRELMAILDVAGVTLRDIDRFAVSTGPGSFTGLRVGIATIQGLALAQRKLVVPITAFEALASIAAAGSQLPAAGFQLPADGFRLAPWIDAHRGEVFAVLYAADGREIHAPTSLAPAATIDAWKDAAGEAPIRFVGDGAVKYRDLIEARLGPRGQVRDDVPRLAGAIARIASAQPDRAVRPHAVVPLYVRRSDAELARDRREARG